MHKKLPQTNFGFFWDSRQLLSSSLSSSIFSYTKAKRNPQVITRDIGAETHKRLNVIAAVRNKFKKNEIDCKYIRIYFPLTTGSQCHPILDQYRTFLFWTAVNRDAVRSLRCSSSLYFRSFPSPSRFRRQHSQVRGDSCVAFSFFNHQDSHQADLRHESINCFVMP